MYSNLSVTTPTAYRKSRIGSSGGDGCHQSEHDEAIKPGIVCTFFVNPIIKSNKELKWKLKQRMLRSHFEIEAIHLKT